MASVDHTGRHSTNPEIVHPAVVRLAEGTAVVRRVVADRPVLVADALLAGVPPEQLATAAGLHLIDLREAVGRWATRLRREDRLTEQGYIDLMNVVFGPAG